MGRNKNTKTKRKKEHKKYMLDTSAIIDDPTNIVRLYDHGQNVVLINNVVFGEVNNLKKSKDGEVGYQARTFSKMLRNSNIKILDKNEYPVGINHREVKKNGDTVVKFEFEHESEIIPLYSIIRNDFRAIKEQLVSMGNELNDLCISELALDYDATLITNDGNLHVYHQVSGGNSEFILNDSFKTVDQQQFLYEVRTPPRSLEKDSDGKFKGDLLKIVKKEFGEDITDFTQFKFIETAKRQENGKVVTYDSGRVEYGIKVGNNIDIIDMDPKNGVMKDSIISWKNKEQALYYYLLTHPNSNIITCSGSTGSGKTLLAIAAGLELMKRGEIESIIYTRNTVTSNDPASEMGFRKGGEDVKLGYFMMPLYSAVNTLINVLKETPNKALNSQSKYAGDTNSFNKENATEIFMRENNIKVVDIAHLRGVTSDKNSMIIIDESQNLSSSGLKLIGTRSGENTKLVILGDGNQIDHPFLTKHRNSLAKMLDIATRDDFVAGMKLTHTVRSKTAEWFDKNL